MTLLSKCGDKGQPCLIPMFMLFVSVVVLFSLINISLSLGHINYLMLHPLEDWRRHRPSCLFISGKWTTDLLKTIIAFSWICVYSSVHVQHCKFQWWCGARATTTKGEEKKLLRLLDQLTRLSNKEVTTESCSENLESRYARRSRPRTSSTGQTTRKGARTGRNKEGDRGPVAIVWKTV
jgi:hypothetical protein